MIRPKGIIFLMLSMLLFCSVTAFAEEYEEILTRADRARGNLAGVEWTVAIVSMENGRREERELKVLAKGYDFLATLTAPAKVKNQKLLMVDRNMWFAKPGLKKPVPISARQRLVGGIAYGDIASTNYAQDYSAMKLEGETIAGEACFVFELTAKTKKATYDKIKYWISKQQALGLKAEYYTVSGKLIKSAMFEFANTVHYDGSDHPFISKMTISDGVVAENTGMLSFSEAKLKQVSDAALDVNLLMFR